MNFLRLHIKCTSEWCCLEFQQTTCHKAEKKKTFFVLWHLINNTVNESLSQCPPALFLRPLTELSELSVAFYQAKHNSNCSADIENLAAFFVVVFVLLTELSWQNETFHQAVRHPEKNSTH